MINRKMMGTIAPASHAASCASPTSCAALLAAALAITVAGPAHAEFLDFGGNFQVVGTNAPNTFSETDTLTLGTTAVDAGMLFLTVSTSAAAGGGEWVVFNYQTVTGLPIAGDLNADWAIETADVPLVAPAVLTQFYLDWGSNGTLTSPTGNAGGNLPIETNPLTNSGLVYGQAYSVDLTTSLGATGGANPFGGFLSSNGFDSSALNEFQFGVLLDPVPVPEPVSLALLGAGLAGLSLVRRTRA